MNKAVFLDRDGVINKERKDYVKKIEEFEIIEGVFEAIKLIKKKGYLVIIITNQSAINRKLMKESDLHEIHNFFKKQVYLNGTEIDGFYYCPHTPFEGCECRKPKPGLILKATQDFQIQLEQSVMIGNSKTDVEAGITAGCKGILLKDSESLMDLIQRYLD